MAYHEDDQIWILEELSVEHMLSLLKHVYISVTTKVFIIISLPKMLFCEVIKIIYDKMMSANMFTDLTQ